MAKLILYSPYYKGNKNKFGRYANYIAKREGVELPKDTKLNLPATKNQKDLIESMLKDFPNSKELLEYSDYISKPTIENASEYISRVLETNIEDEGMGKYIQYMANRTGVEKIATHGLFSDNGTPIILSKVENELNNYSGNVWTHIISLRREDASRLGFDNVKAWQDLLSAKRNEIAKQMNIAPENFKWYAAFHNEGHHPHVHMIAYSTKSTEPYLTKTGIRNIKSSLAREIFKNDLMEIYNKQTEYRDKLKLDSQKMTEKLVGELKHGNFHNEKIEQLLFQLNDMLKATSGKKVYGYLKPEIKTVVDMIVDELARDEHIESLYELWYSQKDAIVSNYTNEKMKRIPLSQNKEFKSVRNMVIKEALQLDNVMVIFDDEVTDEPIIISLDETEPEPPNKIEEPVYYMNPSKKYWKAKRLLDENSDEFDFEKGFELLTESANEGNEYAQYRLGKMIIQGELCDKNIEKGVSWLEKSVTQHNQWAEYFLGKQYLGNGDVDKNYKRAIHLLSKSANQNNPYAQYTLACQYLYTDNFTGKIREAISLLEHSAEQKFVPAEKMLAFILLKGELLPKDEKRVFELLLHCARKGDDKAQYALAKLFLKSDVIPKNVGQALHWLKEAVKQDNEWAKLLLGKMLLFGIDISKDEDAGIELLQSAAEQGNEYAKVILEQRAERLRSTMALSTMRLFGYMGNLFRKKMNADNNKTGFVIDKKQRKQIQEKKMAHGLRQ